MEETTTTERVSRPSAHNVCAAAESLLDALDRDHLRGIANGRQHLRLALDAYDVEMQAYDKAVYDAEGDAQRALAAASANPTR